MQRHSSQGDDSDCAGQLRLGERRVRAVSVRIKLRWLDVEVLRAHWRCARWRAGAAAPAAVLLPPRCCTHQAALQLRRLRILQELLQLAILIQVLQLDLRAREHVGRRTVARSVAAGVRLSPEAGARGGQSAAQGPCPTSRPSRRSLKLCIKSGSTLSGRATGCCTHQEGCGQGHAYCGPQVVHQLPEGAVHGASRRSLFL